MNVSRILGIVSLALAVSAGWSAQGADTRAKPRNKAAPDPAFAAVKDDLALPRVLLIGDSISIGYTVPTRKSLKGKANVHRIPTNGGPTINGLKNLDSWLGNGKWDVIHFNWGLHDLKLMPDGKHQVPIDQYEKNLRELVARLKKTGAKLIWAGTTPVPEGNLNPPRKDSDVVAYNAVARKIMEENQIAIDDLYAFARPRLDKIQLPVNVHFTAEGYRALAAQVATSILVALGQLVVGPEQPLASVDTPRSDTGKPPATAPRSTQISIVNGKWHLNGNVIYAGAKAEGLLMNVRVVNSVFEDTARADFNPDANTDNFIAQIPDYAAHGVRAFTICLQGGMPGYEGAVNSAFNPDGSLRDDYLRRVRRVIEACDRQGVAVILGCFYQRQDQILKDADAVRAGVANVARWIKTSGLTNVMLEIANEFDHGGFDHPIIRTPDGMAELIRLAKDNHPDLLVSASGLGHGKMFDPVARAADFLLIHFNGTPHADIPGRIQALGKYEKPIVCNEDDKVGEAGAKAAELCVANGASWGFMAKAVNQYFAPGANQLQFAGHADDPAVYAALKRLTTGTKDTAPEDRVTTTAKDSKVRPDSKSGLREETSPQDYQRRVEEILSELCAAVEKGYKDIGLTRDDVQEMLRYAVPPARSKKPYLDEARPAVRKAREEATRKLVALGAGAVPALLQARDKSLAGVNEGDLFLGPIVKIGQTAAPALIEGLDDPDWVTRRRAASALIKVRDPRAVEPLIRRLEDSSISVVDAAAQALGTLGDAKAVEPLLKLWDGPQIITTLRPHIARSLGQIGDKRAVVRIIAELENCLSKVSDYRTWSNERSKILSYSELLGELGDSRAVPKRMRIVPHEASSPFIHQRISIFSTRRA
jgi:lysophospholipase L1-like esterase